MDAILVDRLAVIAEVILSDVMHAKAAALIKGDVGQTGIRRIDVLRYSLVNLVGERDDAGVEGLCIDKL